MTVDVLDEDLQTWFNMWPYSKHVLNIPPPDLTYFVLGLEELKELHPGSAYQRKYLRFGRGIQHIFTTWAHGQPCLPVHTFEDPELQPSPLYHQIYSFVIN